MVESALLRNENLNFFNNNNNSSSYKKFRKNNNNNTKAYYLDNHYYTLNLKLITFNSKHKNNFFSSSSHKSIKRLRYLLNLNCKKKPR